MRVWDTRKKATQTHLLKRDSLVEVQTRACVAAALARAASCGIPCQGGWPCQLSARFTTQGPTKEATLPSFSGAGFPVTLTSDLQESHHHHLHHS